MSWFQWRGITWQVAQAEACLRVHIRAPDEPEPRVQWSLDTFHAASFPTSADASAPRVERWVSLDIPTLNFPRTDWHRLANTEIRATAAWHDAAAAFSACGNYLDTQATALHTRLRYARDQEAEETGSTDRHWVGHDFILRFGTRDGLSFPCELDAWLLPEKKYYRLEPESAAELARFGEGPPTCRIITLARFVGGNITLPRCGDDPLPAARRELQRLLGLDELFEWNLDWNVRSNLNGNGTERMPGWRSRLSFRTEPYERGSPA
jgi:hypothetical protein